MSEFDHDSGWLAATPPGTFLSRLPNSWQGGRATHGVLTGAFKGMAPPALAPSFSSPTLRPPPPRPRAILLPSSSASLVPSSSLLLALPPSSSPSLRLLALISVFL